jgi:phospholipid/cholesterol/gamma-HCH transport system permease protein
VTSPRRPSVLGYVEGVGRRTVAGVEELGYAASLLIESLYWLLAGARRRQPVRAAAVFGQMMEMGVQAVPIVAVLSMTVGVMLAIQGIHTLRTFGAESQVVLGIALSVTREFAPLITGILVAGRSGSALTARLGTMQVSQEIDALRVMGVSPVRYLVAPALLGMLLMLPCLTLLADILGILGGGLYSGIEMGMTLHAYVDRSLEVLSVDDVRHGLLKSLVFAVIIVLIGVSNGFSVAGGAEGVGRATTRSVVLSIAYILIADMAFTFVLMR